MTKVLVEIRKKKTSESILVDLIDDAEAFVEDVTGLLWSRVLESWRRRKPDCDEYAMLRTIFHREVEQLKGGAKSKLFERDENAYVQAEAELLERCGHNPELFLTRAWRYYGKQLHQGIVVFIDNVDRASEDFQRRTYAFAHALAAATGATVIVPMREMTFFRGKSAGFLDVRSSDIVYHLQAPDPVQVLAKRIKYVEGELESDHRYRQLKQSDNGDALLAACRRHALTLKNQLLERPSGRQIISYASSVAWHDIRSFLVCVHEVHAALGGTDWVAEKAVSALLVARDPGGRAWIPNLYAPPYPAYASMFVKARTLALLLYSTVPERVKQGLPLSEILRVLRVYGYRDRWSRRAVEELVRDRLLECLEAPAAAEYTKTYDLEDKHSFRPSPMAVVLVESIQFHAAYLGIIGADLTFHSPRVHAEYVTCLKSLLEVMDDRQLDDVGIALLLESEAPKLVGRYLRQMFDKERPLPDLARYSPEVSAIELRLKEAIGKLPGESERTGTTASSPQPHPSNTQLALAFTGSDTSSTGEDRPVIPLPELLPAARIGQSSLGPAILWALAELQTNGQTPAIGAKITEVINAHVYSDQDRKESANVSRALRHPVLRAEGWLAVYGAARNWRYGLSSTWRKDWRRIFNEPPPLRSNKDR